MFWRWLVQNAGETIQVKELGLAQLGLSAPKVAFSTVKSARTACHTRNMALILVRENQYCEAAYVLLTTSRSRAHVLTCLSSLRSPSPRFVQRQTKAALVGGFRVFANVEHCQLGEAKGRPVLLAVGHKA